MSRRSARKRHSFGCPLHPTTFALHTPLDRRELRCTCAWDQSNDHPHPERPAHLELVDAEVRLWRIVRDHAAAAAPPVQGETAETI